MGSSGELSNSGYGAAIDAHDAVFRCNDAPTGEYSADVGNRTTFRLGSHYVWGKYLATHPSFDARGRDVDGTTPVVYCSTRG